MPLQVKEVKQVGNKHIVTIFSEDMEETVSLDAKRMAVNACPHVSNPGLSNMPFPYPVDKDGKIDDDLILHRREGIIGYQADYEVSSGLL